MKKQVKENPMIKNQKNVKIKVKSGKDNSGDENEIKSFIIILVVILVVVGIIYGITELLKDDNNDADTSDVAVGVVNYEKIVVGTLLNRPYSEYYVLAYDADASDAILYSTLLDIYSSSEDSIKIYSLDLSNNLNSPYYNKNGDGKSNPSAKSIDELNLGDLTLIKVKNSKIKSYIEDYNEIKKILG